MKREERRSAFTLIEVMVVVVILGILATVVTVKVTQYLAKAKVKTARVQMREGFLDAIPPDPWGNAFEYMSDTEHGYDLVCYGADGQEGGEGNDGDLNSWELTGGSSEEGEDPGNSSSSEGE
jgi:general secretion pathway protein G